MAQVQLTGRPVSQVEEFGSKAVHRAACSECQRRKQKCNKQWPCNQCDKRKVADQCWFPQDHNPKSGWHKSETVQRKRAGNFDSDGDSPGSLSNDDLEAMGYGSAHHLAMFEQTELKQDLAQVPQFMATPENCPQLKRALDAIPAQIFVDSLMNHFLDNVNFYYYIVYPSSFLKEYQIWCRQRDAKDAVGVQWTCLLVMVLACAIQHADTDLTGKLEQAFGKSTKELSQEYHDIARELHGVIPVERSHVFSIQYLLHSCYWFKAEAKFADCWHMLGAAVREGQRIGLHHDALTKSMSDFDREMCRRLWCILDAWDWLVSALLARPMLIDRADCTAQLPQLNIEKYPVSPLLHMKFQSDLIGRIFKRFGPPKNISALEDIRDYEEILRVWMETFPAAFRFDNPDKTAEASWPWVELHRHYLHTTALSLALGPLKQFLIKPVGMQSPDIEIELRADGVEFALRLMEAVHGFFNYVWERDTTFHFVPFCIFDTAVHLVHALMNDEDGSVPKWEESMAAIRQALSTLSQLAAATDTAKKPHSHLQGLFTKLTAKNSGISGKKRMKLDKAPRAPITTTEVTQQQPTVMGSTAQVPIALEPIPEAHSVQVGGISGHGGSGANYGYEQPFENNGFGRLDAIEPPACFSESFPCSASTHSTGTTDSSAVASTISPATQPNPAVRLQNLQSLQNPQHQQDPMAHTFSNGFNVLGLPQQHHIHHHQQPFRDIMAVPDYTGGSGPIQGEDQLDLPDADLEVMAEIWNWQNLGNMY